MQGKKIESKIRGFTLQNWRQFENVNFTFHENLTILVGANGTGKTSILHILAGRFNFPTVGHCGFVSTPSGCNLGKTTWKSDHTGRPKVAPMDKLTVGYLRINDNKLRALVVDKRLSRLSSVGLVKQENIHGIHIPSYRIPLVKKPLDANRLPPEQPTELLKRYLNQYNRLMQGDVQQKDYMHPWLIVKDWLYRLATTAGESEYSQGDLENKRILENFCGILQTVFPKEIGFQKIQVRGDDIVFQTSSGEFNMDSLSGGLATLFDICFLLFLCSLKYKNFAVTFDEPENHLHVSMQRRLFPDLQKAFPGAQFIVATHSPTIVNSVENSNIYVLRWNSKRMVESILLDDLIRSGTADDILRDVLDVGCSLPIWATQRLEEIIKKHSSLPFSNATIDKLRNELIEAGLGQYAPEAITSICEKFGDDKN